MLPYQNMARGVPEINAVKRLQKKQIFVTSTLCHHLCLMQKTVFRKNVIKQRVWEVCLWLFQPATYFCLSCMQLKTTVQGKSIFTTLQYLVSKLLPVLNLYGLTNSLHSLVSARIFIVGNLDKEITNFTVRAFDS